MANKKVNISLIFDANTQKAKQQIQDLQKSLDNIIKAQNKQGKTIGLSDELLKAQQATIQLKSQLSSALDVDTGKLDLAKFNHSLKQSGKTLNDYKTTLMAMGPEGQKAFVNLTTSIMQAEVPLKKTNKYVEEIWDNLGKVAKWEMSSAVIHGLESALSGAVGYAQDLDKSLNNIRIVTGQNAEQMAKFAEQANKAAKALSATTTDYTNASLIYYQQGLSDQEVAARTEATIKMANVTGQSAQTVSDQMTSIWNNYADGAENLEYFADVLTALGAATASSTEEISTGLRKFSAIAESVGLSYEYATAALATVTATTRESADVVGTAYKTLFSRIQGLQLGETLDDGTTLNKYSTALEKVGINIKDQFGELKDMNTILDEMGSKWGTLSKDQQLALAQTVAGKIFMLALNLSNCGKLLKF